MSRSDTLVIIVLGVTVPAISIPRAIKCSIRVSDAAVVLCAELGMV